MRSVLFVSLSYFGILTGSAAAQQDTWQFHGSVVQLVGQGGSTRLIFQSTTGLLSAQGANAGAMLFEGKRDAQILTGLAYSFSAGCLPESYEVKGGISQDGESLSLAGRVPVRDSACQVLSHPEQTITLTRAQPTAPPPLPPSFAAPAAPSPRILPTVSVTSPPPTTPAPPARPPLWNHNGSTMYLVAKGRSREFRYEQPSSRMSAAGVRKDTVLFRGEFMFASNSYEGTAYRFSSRCGMRSYQVSGPVSGDKRRVVLSGQAPQIDSNCSVTGYVSDRLEFEVLPKY